MKKGIKIALIVAAGMIVLGGITLTVIVCGIRAGRIVTPDLDTAIMSGAKFQEQTFPLADDGSVRVRVMADEVTVGMSEDGLLHLSYYDTTFVENVARADDRGVVLTQEVLSQTNRPDFLRWIAEWNANTGVSVLLPQSFRGELTVTATTGDVTVTGQELSLLAVSSTTGRLDASDITCKTVTMDAATGSIMLENAVIDGALTVCSTTGDARLHSVSAASLERRTSSGETRLTDVSAESVFVNATTGSVRLTRLLTDSLTVRLTTGSVSGTLKGAEQDYADALSLSTGTGDIDIDYTD